ncbi:MAG TPA: carboxypeptidase regulatory-like domain-containing protein [Vicinamibacterales bacterium]|nr:carboxypeptidase regulatory-like domain-containing protein [Vicinamibacterales bacterium]
MKHVVVLLVCATLVPSTSAFAQGVTTASVTGLVKDAQGGVIPGASISAVHQPSGTQYEAVTQADGRFTIPGMRVGGPYTVTAQLSGFTTEVKNNITLALGVTQDMEFSLKVATISETITVVGASDPVFSTSHTGAATAVMREDLASLPTISGRITDITRLTPQYNGSGSFAGQDNRANNVTVDGSYFNNSFGLGTTTGGIGDRTGVAPISLEAIEQVQVNVAPYDVRQGNFVGAGVNTVTRSGTNNITASVYRRMRSESYVGTDAAGQTFNPGTFTTYTTGTWAGGPIVKNKLFAFGAYEKQEDTRPLTTFQSNPGGAPVGGNFTRVLSSDLTALSSFLKNSFSYDTGPFDNISKLTPAKPWMVKGDFNVNSANKVTFRYNQLDSSTDVNQSGSSSLGTSRQTGTTQFLTFSNSNYQILENLKSGVGEWNSVFGTMTNNLLIGYTHQDESRGDKGQVPLFPFVVIGAGDGSAYTSFGNEPFTPFNLLRYNTFQLQDSVTKFANKHSLTFGGNVEKFHSDNSFYFGIQSAYSYNTLADFYADANGYLANQNRTVAAAASRFQVKYLLQPGQTTPPMQPLDVVYAGAYVQDEWRPRANLTVTAGLRVDVPHFGNTAFDNPVADTLTFRNQDGSPVQYNSGALPETTAYWSPRVGFNLDATNDQKTQVRGGTGVFSGKPPYVWISNQIGNTGVLYGFLDSNTPVTTYPFNPSPDRYKPAATGGTAASYELDVTDQGFRFPQTWRSNIGIDRKLPWGLIGTFDYLYGRDLNAPVYINANLPAADTAYTGVDNRPRWAPIAGVPACITALGSENGPCVTKINNLPGKNITAAYVIKNQDQNRAWNVSAAVTKPMSHGLMLKGGFNYGRSRSVVEPSSTAGSSWGSANPIVFDPNNPALTLSSNTPGKRFFLAGTYSHQYFGWGATTISAFYDARPNFVNFSSTASYVFSGDANGDTVIGNDLIYIPRDISEMNFVTFTAGGRTYTAAEQAAAFEQYIQNDPYLRDHRGQYAERNGVFNPIVNRIDVSLTQDVFHSIGGRKHSGQIRLDVTNFGNLLNHDWGVGQRLVNAQILTNPGPDAQGRLSYRMQLLNGNLITSPFQTAAGTSDVYVAMLSFRYTFQ